MINIGLMDYDSIHLRRYHYPNYDLGVIYAYYQKNKEVNVRLITSLSPKNLKQYDKIYVFKDRKYLPHPSAVIKNYYNYPIEEYGPGFIEKPLRPFILETKFIRPDFKCYNGIIIYSISNPRSKLSWKISSRKMDARYEPVRLYEDFEGESLKKDLPTTKKIAIYDDPVQFFNDTGKWQELNNLIQNGCKIKFAHDPDISLITNTNILERVLRERKYASIRKIFMCSNVYNIPQVLIDHVIERKNWSRFLIQVPIEPNFTPDQYLKILLTMGYWGAKTQDRLRLIPVYGIAYLNNQELAQLAFKYLIRTPSKMSYYEYVFNIGYLRQGVPRSLLHTGEEYYNYVYSHYKPPKVLIKLEEWLKSNPDYEEHVFIGGSSKYERGRKEIFNVRRSSFNVIECDN